MHRRGLLWICLLGMAPAAFGTSFVVPGDYQFVRKAPTIVLASALESHTRINDNGGIETVTTFSIEETIKGTADTDTISIVEPGGVYEHRASFFPGVPRFTDGERYLLFLMKSGDERWHVLDLTLGKFRFATDVLGHDVAVRDLNEVVAFDRDGTRHREGVRAAAPFLEFVRDVAKGAPAREDGYLIPAEPLLSTPTGSNTATGQRFQPRVLATYTAASYSTDISSGTGFRWTSFPQHFGSIGSEPGALGSPAGATAINAAFNAWNTATGASVSYIYDGADAGTMNSPCVAGDSKNSIGFEQNLACAGVSPFTCSGMGYSGVLGLGGTSSAGSPTNMTPDGSTFYTQHEGDVWMNQGIANCTLLLTTNVGDWNSAVTHEVGHTLGFRHADKTRTDSGSCSGDVTLECVSSAIMTSVVTSGLSATPQAWDLHAVSLIYPSTAPAAVTGVSALGTSTTNIQVSWTGSCATECHIYFRTGNLSAFTRADVGGVTTSPFNHTVSSTLTAYQYKVVAFNGTESASSNIDLAINYVFTDDPLVAGSTGIKAIHLTELRAAIDAVLKLANNGAPNPYAYTDSTITQNATIVKAVHVTDLRSALDIAMTSLGGTVGGYTDSTLNSTIPIKRIHIQEIRDRIK